ncbi:cytochrome c oxidase subunit 3 [Mycolicibacterium septicum]|uniref:cytochrome c oxidase subunit 3 n=1 Tax=Mycolicibacterium septicum TaxID=98668 RepID=UPI0023614E98|nr:cytochrome c oxidase subunit 3 [Mycolicibacterium septicum]
MLSHPPDASPRRISGEPGMWLFVLADVTLFAFAFGAFLYDRGKNPVSFAAGNAELHLWIGAVDTIILLTTSLVVALAVRNHRRGEPSLASRLVMTAVIGAGLFAMFKAIEWGSLIGAGDVPVYGDDFFAYFFALTGLHFLHLVIGVVVLLVLRTQVAAGAEPAAARTPTVEVCANYWHLVDLLWLIIFPLVYIMPSI